MGGRRRRAAREASTFDTLYLGLPLTPTLARKRQTGKFDDTGHKIHSRLAAGIDMQPRMSKPEIELFVSFVRHSHRYVEFGVGGTTCLASEYVADWILAVDSSEAWIAKVALACAGKKTQPAFLYADIGPTGDWGVPIDPQTRPRWQGYHSDIWKAPQS